MNRHMYKPMLALPAPKPFSNKDWIFEIKWDGFRAIAYVDEEFSLKSRNGKELKNNFPDKKIIAMGHPNYAARIKELDDVILYKTKEVQTGSIFMEDPSFAFDYAHILPLVEKCSILHGHTSSVMVELVGEMKNNLLIDFGEAKKIIKEIISILDHKFFINERYLIKEDDIHYKIAFDGPKGMFDLQVPKNTTYLLEGEATVENLSTEIIKLLIPKMPGNIEAVGVYIYEGYNKGAHILSHISKS